MLPTRLRRHNLIYLVPFSPATATTMSSSSAVAADISPQYLSADRGPSIVVTYWILTGIATIVVGLRFYVRYTIKSIGYDDWWMLVALVGRT